MSIHDGLYTKVSGNATIQGAIGNPVRFYPGVAPTSATLPYVTYQRIGNPHLHHQTAAAGLCNAVFQFDIWATSSTSAATVAEAFRGQLQGMTTATWGSTAVKRVFLDDERDDYGNLLKGEQLGSGGLYRITQTFSIWYAESVPSL